MTEKQYHVDFEEWIIWAKDSDEAYKKIEERFCDGEIPKVSSIEEN